MKSLISRFNCAIILATSVMSCSKNDGQVLAVSGSDYRSEKCWFNQAGNFSALLVLAARKQTVIPYVVSLKCRVDENYTSNGGSILQNLNKVRIIDPNLVLEKKLPGMTIVDTRSSEQFAPSTNSIVYKIEARVEEVPWHYDGVYAIRDIKTLRPTNVTFGKLLEMTSDQRGDLRLR